MSDKNYKNIKVVTYRRKSTDREDKQQASLPAQLSNIKKTVAHNKLTVVREFEESVSAKKEGTRKGFNEMVKMIESGEVQGIVVDEPTRLSRNTLDAARIVYLMESLKLQYVFTSAMVFSGKTVMEVAMLENLMQWAKVDNKLRSKSVKEKMHYKAEHEHKLMIKAPFGYQNYREGKTLTDVRPHPDNAVYWKEMLRLLDEGLTYAQVGKILFDKFAVATKYGNPFGGEMVRQCLFNTFHDGQFNFGGVAYAHNHSLIVSPEYVNQIRAKRLKFKMSEQTLPKQFPFKGMIRTHWGKHTALSGARVKGHIYYANNSKHSDNGKNVNISQNLIIEQFGDGIDLYTIQSDEVKTAICSIMRQYFTELQKDSAKLRQATSAKLATIENKQSKLLSLLCDDKISQAEYDQQRAVFFEESQKHAKVLEGIVYLNDEILIKAERSVELLTNLKQAWINANLEKKINIIKMIGVELQVDTKKQLYVHENELFKNIRSLNIKDGGPDTLQCGTRKLMDIAIYHTQRFTELCDELARVMGKSKDNR